MGRKLAGASCDKSGGGDRKEKIVRRRRKKGVRECGDVREAEAYCPGCVRSWENHGPSEEREESGSGAAEEVSPFGMQFVATTPCIEVFEDMLLMRYWP